MLMTSVRSKKRYNKQFGKNSAKSNNSQYRIEKFTKILKDIYFYVLFVIGVFMPEPSFHMTQNNMILT